MAEDNLPTFGLASAFQLLSKLNRELGRIHTAENLKAASDHCFNAAITAWHLHDWIWREIRGNHPLIAKIANEAGIPPSEFGKRKWQNYIQDARTGCPELRFCRLIANASKHAVVNYIEGDPEPVQVSGSPQEGSRWKVRVKDESPELAIDVFATARDYFNKIIMKYGLIDGLDSNTS